MPATNGNDVLNTTFDGQILHGLGGDDKLTSFMFNNTALYGDLGNDTLDTEILASGPLSIIARQFGGRGDDQLLASADVTDASVTFVLDGGDGNDELRAFTTGSSLGDVELANTAYGGDGNDLIDLTVGGGGQTSGSVTNTAFGGAGDDTIYGSAIGRFGSPNFTISNVMDGGAGNDMINAFAGGAGFSSGSVINKLAGGLGDDIIWASAVNSASGTSAVFRNELDGGQGNDTLAAFYYEQDNSTTSTNSTTVLAGETGNDNLSADSDGGSISLSQGLPVDVKLTHRLSGGQGEDSLVSTLKSDAQTTLDTVRLDGGDGSDGIQSSINASTDVIANFDISAALTGGTGNDNLKSDIGLSFSKVEGSLLVENNLAGGAGNDYLEANLSGNVTDASATGAPAYFLGTNNLSGGAGNDVLVARVGGGDPLSLTQTTGQSILDGGAGEDQLTVVGGDSNVLDGGVGRDRLTGGAGQDNFTGGAGADSFVFVARGDSAYATPDRITDFSRAQGDKIDLTALGITSADLVITHGAGQNYTAAVDFDHNGSFDFGIAVVSVQAVTSGDFMF